MFPKQIMAKDNRNDPVLQMCAVCWRRISVKGDFIDHTDPNANGNGMGTIKWLWSTGHAVFMSSLKFHNKLGQSN